MSRYLLSHFALSTLAASACMMSDTGVGVAAVDPAATSAPAATGVAEFEFPNLTGKQSFDCALIPANVRLDFLKSAVRAYIANRLNGVHTRYEKDPVVTAWAAYDAATKADPLQSVVPQPTNARPAQPDYAAAYAACIADLTAGNVRRAGATGEPKARKIKDPLISTVTDVVVRAVYDAKRATDAKYSFLSAKAEVGPDGVAYLNKLIDAKVAAAAALDPTTEAATRTALEKVRDQQYINPAKAMLGLTTAKGLADLPSIL